MAQYEFHYQRVELLKTEELGVGSYGAVCKAMCDDLPCAAKILHRTLFQFTAPGNTSVMQKFEQECRLLSAIKHPHIVQYLGTYHDPESKLPVLLMELMEESLTQFLERSHEPLPYYTEVNLCHDIALALSYLHSNGIVHRDLSSNNVLLIAGSRAKVTDFGMVKLYDVNCSTAHLTPLTLCPGTSMYMSPEALGEPPMYTDKLDSFSFGVLGVQIMTRQFPDPGNRFQAMEINDPRIPSGRVQVEIPEIERRQSHIDLIDPANPLLPVALECLKDRERERPSCHELCGRMSTLKASPKYTESVQQSQVNTKPTQSAERESREREIQPSQQIQDLQQQLHTKDDQLRGREQENLELRTLLSTKDEQLAGKEQQLAGKDRQLQQKEAAIAAHQQEIQRLRQQLQSSEQVTAEFQQNLLEKEAVHEHVTAEFQQNLLEREKTIQDQQRQILELQQQLSQRGGQRQATSINRESKEREIQQSRDLQQQLHTLRGQLQEKEQENQRQWQQIMGQQNLLTAINEQVQTLRQQLATKDEQLAGKDHQLQQKEAAVAAHQQEIQRLRQELQSSEQVSAELQQTVQDKQRQIQELRQQLSQRREQEEASGAAASGGNIKLRWRNGGNAPCQMCGEVTAVDGSKAYFQPEGHEVFAYSFAAKKWSELPKCPNRDFSLAVVNGLLTAIGGETPNHGGVTNSLLSFTDNRWVKQFPPMPTKRWLTITLCSGKSLVVAGGIGEGDKYLSTVEVMDTQTLQWSTANSLPHPLVQASATLCGDQVYILGGWDQGYKSKSVFTCSLAALLKSCNPQSLLTRLKTLSLASEPKVWVQLPDTPYYRSAIASVQGQLLSVGGCDSGDRKVTAVYLYNTTTNSWKIISRMTIPRQQCSVVALPHNGLMVVGGRTPGGPTDSVEIATIV